jgi:hypothetical protein
MLNRFCKLLPDVSEEEKTEIIDGIENTALLSLQCFARLKERQDSYGDDTLASAIVTTEAINNAYKELFKRRIKARLIIEFMSDHDYNNRQFSLL